jgi:sortase (surface protein transpeptidase)
MKTIIFVLLLGIVIFLLYNGGYITMFVSKANLELEGVFVPSRRNIEEIDDSSAANTSFPGLEIRNNFVDFSEASMSRNGFYLRIDKVNLFKFIVQDVDPRYKDEYVESWKYGISHGKFTSTPNRVGITYLFAHAVSNPADVFIENAWFTYLDKLELDDEIIIYYQGMKYTYAVSAIRFVKPDATGFYTGASAISKVRLQFCGPPTGSLDYRTLIDGILVSSEKI